MTPQASPDLFTFNGIDADSGGYLQPPMTAEELLRFARGESFDASHLSDLQWRRDQATSGGHYGVVEGIDSTDLAQAGWGVIFTADSDPAIREALKPLLDLRREQASARREGLYREYSGPDGYRPGESKPAFLARHGVGPGPVDPVKMPYYLLLVGDPENIPYRFQYQIDVQFAVGRIHFDALEEYAAYARSVVDAENGKIALARRAAFFGVANPDDAATQLSASDLVAPLAEFARAGHPEWTVDLIAAEQANKTRLAGLLGGSATPALLFTATHGMSFRNGDSRQTSAQGALLCQDWPGPSWRQPVPESFYFAAGDLPSDARLAGLISMHFACYGGGTPQSDEFAPMGATERAAIAPRAFVAGLPKALLAHPRGGALAAIGHVERAWGCSFRWNRAGRQLQAFESALKCLMGGQPVGAALEYFNSRYAELSSDLTVELEELKFNRPPDPYNLASMWTANNDARGYAIVGDPAVRLPLAVQGASEMRPERPMIMVSSPATAAPPAAPGPQTTATEPQYGLLDPLRNAQTALSGTLQQVLCKLGETLQRVVESAMTVEVATYVADDVSLAKFENGQFTGARLRALTRVSLDGRTLVCVPENEGKVDEDLWKIHSDALARALANRADMMKLAASAASNLLAGFKVL
jgi:hypothetical protein